MLAASFSAACVPLAVEVPDVLQSVQVDKAHSQDKEYQPHHIEPVVVVGTRENKERMYSGFNNRIVKITGIMAWIWGALLRGKRCAREA